MTYRVVLWGTGNVGRNALIGIDARPDLELAGVWVSNPTRSAATPANSPACPAWA